ncbi:MAG: BrnT family toxin [Myxococcales bacterium]|nr:BrnT family toxin [Myxococcales bacterium]
MYVIELIWREAGDVRGESDEDHLARHGVTADEFEQAFWSEPLWRPVGNRGERYVAFARTESGRCLMLVIEPWNESEGLWSPVTARDATRRERKKYLGES